MIQGLEIGVLIAFVIFLLTSITLIFYKSWWLVWFNGVSAGALVMVLVLLFAAIYGLAN